MRRTLAGTAALALVGTALISGLPGQVPAAYASEASSGTNFKMALTSDIDNLNPFIRTFATSASVLDLQYEALVEWSSKDNTETPGMSDEWKTSPDGKVWTFHLPDNRKWSDGEPVTADDPAYTINAIKGDDKLKQANGSLVENIESAVATDKNTLTLTLRQPQAPNPGTDLPIMPKHAWEKQSDPASYANDKDTVGSGPFYVVSYDKAGGITMKANPNFWRGAAKLTDITWVPYKSLDAAVQALKTGEIDFVGGLTPAQFTSLKGQDGIGTNAGQGRRYSTVMIAHGDTDVNGDRLGDTNPVLEDPKVRQAIIMGIDNKTLLDKVLTGYGEVPTAEVPAYYPKFHWDTDPATLPYAFNPEKANQLLDSAGYRKGADGIRLDKKGKPISLRLLGRSTDPTNQQSADYIVAWLKDIGIDVKSEMKAANQVSADHSAGKYDMYFTGWGMSPDPDFQLSINLCSARVQPDGTGTSEGNFCSPEFDKLYQQQHTELDPAKRAELVVQAQRVIYDAAINNVLYYPNSLEAYRSDKFGGFHTQPAQGGVISSQNGYWGIYSTTPVASATDTGGGIGGGATAGIFAAVIVVAGVITLFAVRRRKATSDDRE